MKAQASRFGTTVEKMEKSYSDGKGILEDFKTALEEIDEIYNALLQDTLETKISLEAEEQKKIMEQRDNKKLLKEAKRGVNNREKELKADIIKATKEGNLELAQDIMNKLKEFKEDNLYTKRVSLDEQYKAKRDEIRESIEECERQYELYLEQKEKMIEEVSQGKDRSLAQIPKQNVFQKVMGAMFNKFNGTKKAVKSAVVPLKTKISSIVQDEIPKIKQQVEEKRNNITSRISSTISNGEKTFRSIVEKGNQMKADTIQQLTEKLKEMQEENNQKSQMLNMDISTKQPIDGIEVGE